MSGLLATHDMKTLQSPDLRFEAREEMRAELRAISDAGTRRQERLVESPQAAHIISAGKELLNFCANNYLGLADRPEVIEAAKLALDRWGFGMASVRFICGTQPQHSALEHALSKFLRTDATILYSSCFDANGGLFEVLLDGRDAVISDELNHASIIDGIRLCKAARHRYRNRNMADLESELQSTAGARRRLIVTDGVFSMDGSIAPLKEVCDLAERYGALVMVDDSHATGIVGSSGAGTPEAAGVQRRVDILSGTLGKALGGASGGYISGRAEIVDLLRQRSRPYLFSNALPPSVIAGSMAALNLAASGETLRETLRENAKFFRRRMAEERFSLLQGEHPIVPVMFGDARLAGRMADAMLDEGVYVTAFAYPVVPEGEARIRVQLSATHSTSDVEVCVQAFVQARENVARRYPSTLSDA